jgi:phenylpyruvate tautomerase PptA (4-oxalocrotonate tautomerase family)
MPIVHIRSLPLAQDTDIARVLEGISKEFAEAIAISVDQIYITWEYLAPGYYVHQGRAAGLQEDNTHPVLVELITPDIFSQTRIELMLSKIAEAICRRIHVPIENIFVTHQEVRSGRVFDHGAVERW